ncbi:MAG: hypothetical protein OXB88_02290, partial [Bacteriovoracales bacterium]|nr:hypothetical protein [Bacteriovoracales bacterium]
ERGVHNPSLLNVQFLQDFAEYCDRSGKEQCHLTLITHLSVSQYAFKLPLDIQKEWAKVEGRFYESSFFDRSTDYYKMIRVVFKKGLKETNRSLYTKWKAYIGKMVKDFKDGALGLDGFFRTSEEVKSIERCYPLHPVALALLPRIAQKVAQNERTLYTFLTRDEEGGLFRFIQKGLSTDKIELLAHTGLYEYFAPLISKDTGIGGHYKVQLIYEDACSKIGRENTLAKEIISLAALLTIVKDSSFSPITEKFLIASLKGDYPTKEIKKEIKYLVENKTFFFNKVKRQYEFVEGSSLDIKEEIRALKQRKLTSKDLVKILKHYTSASYITPNKYNFEHNTVRFFRGEIISFEELSKISEESKPKYSLEDGILYYIIPFSKDELDQSIATIQNLHNECTAFILPNNFIECQSDLEELNAVNALYTNKEVITSGPLVRKELDRYRDILIESVRNVTSILLGKTFLKARCFYPKRKEKMVIGHFSELNRFLGHIFEWEYTKSIDFNSEYTNRHKVTGNIALARKEVINGIIKNKGKKDFGLAGNGPNIAILKALRQLSPLKFKGQQLKFKKSSSLEAGLNSYKKMILKKGGILSENLIEHLVAPPFGIRKGILPLLFAIWDQSLEGQVSHYCDGSFITEVDGDHYDMIMKQPKICRIQYSEISRKKRTYIKELAQSLTQVEIKKAVGMQELLEYIYTWRKTIPEFTKLSSKLNKSSRKLLMYIDSSENPEKLIFNQIPESLNYDAITGETTLKEINNISSDFKKSLDSIYKVYPNLIEDLNIRLIEALHFLQIRCLGEKPFKYSKGCNLAKIFQETLARFNDNLKDYSFSPKTLKFL